MALTPLSAKKNPFFVTWSLNSNIQCHTVHLFTSTLDYARLLLWNEFQSHIRPLIRPELVCSKLSLLLSVPTEGWDLVDDPSYRFASPPEFFINLVICTLYIREWTGSDVNLEIKYHVRWFFSWPHRDSAFFPVAEPVVFNTLRSRLFASHVTRSRSPT